jgi:hypothetical protein
MASISAKSPGTSCWNFPSRKLAYGPSSVTSSYHQHQPWGMDGHCRCALTYLCRSYCSPSLAWPSPGIFNVCNTLIVDLHPDAPATASASVSITRCLTAALGLSIQQLLSDSIGTGWTFTLISALCYMTLSGLIVVRCRGWDWRLGQGSSDSPVGGASHHGRF